MTNSLQPQQTKEISEGSVPRGFRAHANLFMIGTVFLSIIGGSKEGALTAKKILATVTHHSLLSKSKCERWMRT